MQFGAGGADYLRDTPDAVAQAVRTRLGLRKGEWFLNTGEGTDYAGAVLGTNTASTRDLELRTRILETQGVRGIVDYGSVFDPNERSFRVAAVLDTVYGPATVEGLL
jgi:hypothetical protein